MIAITKYLIFIIVLSASVYAAANFELSKSSVNGSWEKNKKPVISGSLIPKKPAHVLSGPQGLTTIDYNPENGITAAGGTGVIKFWKLPDEKPLRDIDTGEGFQVLSVCFLNRKGLIAAAGRTTDSTGRIMIYDTSSGKLTLRIDDPEPVIFLDPHPEERYVLATGLSYIKVWDLRAKTALAVIQKNNRESRGYFFMEGQYVLQSDSLSLYDLTNRKIAGVLNTVSPVVFKKTQDNDKYAYISGEGLSTVHANGRREFIPISTNGIYAFDVSCDGKWGLFLNGGQKMAVIDIVNGKTVKTIEFDSPPVDVSINSDCSSAYVLYKSGNIGVFDIGNRNTFRNMRFYAVKFLKTANDKITCWVEDIKRYKR